MPSTIACPAKMIDPQLTTTQLQAVQRSSILLSSLMTPHSLQHEPLHVSLRLAFTCTTGPCGVRLGCAWPGHGQVELPCRRDLDPQDNCSHPAAARNDR